MCLMQRGLFHLGHLPCFFIDCLPGWRRGRRRRRRTAGSCSLPISLEEWKWKNQEFLKCLVVTDRSDSFFLFVCLINCVCIRQSMMPCCRSLLGREFLSWLQLYQQKPFILTSMTCCPWLWTKLWVLPLPFYLWGQGKKKKKSSTSNLHCSCFSSMTLSLPLACRSLPARWQIVPSLWARLARHCTPWLVCQEAGLSQESCPIGCCPCSWLVLETVMQRCAITVCSAWEL